jgi:8-oxo-dGTP pyrophosphatase MutT (NUDIX family)
MLTVYGPASRLRLGGEATDDDRLVFCETTDSRAYDNVWAAWLKYGRGGLCVPRPSASEGWERAFAIVEAAGALVLSPDETRALIIFRHGKYDLPKGKRDGDETPEQTALRETAEETGARALGLLRPLCLTRHVYQDSYQNGRWTLKRTQWFLVKCQAEFPFRPQHDEGVTAVEFVPLTELSRLDVYPSVADVFRAFYVYQSTNGTVRPH